jgi:pyridoxal phosphate enzyme (YggS family)
LPEASTARARQRPRNGADNGTNGAVEQLAIVRERIAAAEREAKRPAGAVTLVAVSKTFDADAIRPVIAAGQRVFGENRVQEAQAKWPALKQAFPDIELHLIGPLQSNKAKRAAALFDCVHSIDRVKIARTLDREAAALGRRLPVFLEVNLGGEPSKHGFDPERLAEAARPLAELEALRVVGLMAVPPPADDPEASRPWFRRLRELAEELAGRPEWAGFPRHLSMGMSDDFEVAVEEGATHVRVGSALFGPREAG